MGQQTWRTCGAGGEQYVPSLRMYKVLSKDLRFPPGMLWRLSLGKVSTEFCIVKAGMCGRGMRSVYRSVLISSWWMCSSDCNYIYLTLYWDAGLSWNGHAPHWLFGADLKILNLCLKCLLHFFFWGRWKELIQKPGCSLIPWALQGVWSSSFSKAFVNKWSLLV